jgi:putative nucleotidyltransferase with HDIG domain
LTAPPQGRAGFARASVCAASLKRGDCHDGLKNRPDPVDKPSEVELRQPLVPGQGRRTIERSVTLMHVFLGASAIILVAGGFVLSWLLTASLTSQAVDLERSSLTHEVDGFLRPELVHGGRVNVIRSTALARLVREQPDLVTVKVWRPDGVLAWASRGQTRIGRRFPLDSELGEAMRENRSVGGVDELNDEENAVEKSLGFSRLLQVYAPIENASGTRAIGAYEIYADPSSVARLIASRKRVIWLAVGLVFLALYAALALLVRHASRTLRRQTEALRDRSLKLMDSYRRLEQNALEAVESLNATVDAKDPYTAGHSQRVQRIALAIGEELALESARLDALRFGGLFHDIGKLGVPDAVLTKPARLTPDEYELIKRHPDDGARIVEKFSRLAEAVPLIRYHHERWDGRGYPEGLAGEQIPLEAGIVGLADAWDAMTTDRPYHRALTLEEAAAEIRRNRGSQFAPGVVDAFFSALRREPAVFSPQTPLARIAAAS